MMTQNNAQHNFFEIVHVNSKKVSCAGSKSGSGHPLVYLNMGKNDSVVCPYCSKYFTTKDANDLKEKK